MSVERKIMMVFISEHIERFNQSLLEKSLCLNLSLNDILLQEARIVSNVLGCHFTDIISKETIDSIIDQYNMDRDSISVRSIDEAIALCDSDIVSVLDESCDTNSIQDEQIIQIVCEVTDKKQVTEIIDLIELFGSNFDVLKQCIQDLCSTRHALNAVSDSKFDQLCAEFTLSHESLLNLWMNKIRAVAVEAKKGQVLTWCQSVVDDSKTLIETFGQKSNVTIH